MKIHNRCYRFKFHESISGGNVRRSFVSDQVSTSSFDGVRMFCPARSNGSNKDLLYRSREPREK